MYVLCSALPAHFGPVRAGYTWYLGRPAVFLCTPRNKTSRYHGTSIPHSVPQWNDLVDRAFDGEALAGFKRGVNASFLT